MPGEMRAPRRPYEARVAQHADRAFAGGLGGQQIPRPIQDLSQNRRQVPKDPPGFEWVFGPGSWDWTITRQNFAIAAGGSAGLTIGTADSYGALPSWGSQFDSTFLYTARSGLFFIYTIMQVRSPGGTCNVQWFTSSATLEMTLQQGLLYEHQMVFPLQADTGSGIYDFIPMPSLVNRSAGSRNFDLTVQVEAVFLV